MPATDISLLTEAAHAGGRIAKRYFGQKPVTWEKADHAGPVSEADIAVNVMLRETLTAARPGYGWLSEESDDGVDRQETDRQFVIDPIDGTRAFLDGSHDWSHSLAVVERGQVLAAVVHLPMKNQTYTAARGQGAALNGAPIRVTATQILLGAQVLSNKANLETRFWRDGEVPGMERHFRSSLAYRMCLVAAGRFDAMITFRPTWEWDVAAGSLIVAEAGGMVTDPDGLSLKFNNRIPQVPGVVAAGGLHNALLAALAPTGSQRLTLQAIPGPHRGHP